MSLLLRTVLILLLSVSAAIAQPGWHHGYGEHYGGGFYHGYGGFSSGVGTALGWGVGAMIARSIFGPPEQQVVVAPAPAPVLRYCSTYRSGDEYTKTFLGYDGQRHPCA